MQNELQGKVEKIVFGLREMAEEAIAIDGGSHSDRINGYAAELALAAGITYHIRHLGYHDMGSSGRCDWAHLREAVGEATTGSRRALRHFIPNVAQGHQNVGTLNYNSLDRIVTAFVDAALASAKSDTAPAKPTPPERLTITIDGPQGSGKTVLAEQLLTADHRVRMMYTATAIRPDIVEMRDGRRFDVRNEVFLDAGPND